MDNMIMELAVRYGNKSETIKLGKEIEVKILAGEVHRTKSDLRGVIERLKEEVREFLSDTPAFLVIVNDYTRPTPTAEILSLLEEEINKKEAHFLVALGSHRLPTTDEYYKIFGRFYDAFKDRITAHQAKEVSSLKFLGKTSFGTPVKLNEQVIRFPKIITINSIEPHYFAGWTGGRKTFLPGVAGYETITANHKLSLKPLARTLNLTSNPVSQDMEEVAQMVEHPVLSIQLIVDQKKELRDIKFGDLRKSFKEGVQEAKAVFCLPIEKRYDCVLAIIQPPYDIDFYQAQKGLENAKLGVKEGGVIILVSACHKGIGDDEFIRVLQKSKKPKEVISDIEKNFLLGAHKSAKLAELVSYCEVLTVVPIEDNIINSIFMKAMKSISEAIDYCYKKFGKSFSLLYLPDATLVTPLSFSHQ